MPDEAQALRCQLMDLKMPGDPGPASLASSRVEFRCRGVMVGVSVPKSHGDAPSFGSPGNWEALPSGSHGRAQALPGGEYLAHISMQTPKQEPQDVLSQGIPLLALGILAETRTRGIGLVATHSQAKVCPLHQIRPEDFCVQQRRKRHCKGSDEASAGKSG